MKSNVIGFMRRAKTPQHLAELTAILCKNYGINLLYFNPGDISTETGKIKGQILLDNKWQDVSHDIPPFIDLRSPVFNVKRYRKKLEFLKQNSILSVDKRLPIPKDKLHYYFGDDPEVSKYLIPSQRINNIKDFFSFLNEYKTVVVKPINSNQGRNVSIISKHGFGYLLGQNKEEQKLRKSQLKKKIKSLFKSNTMIVQKYIKSKTPSGHPFDCRIHVEKNGEGKWSNPENFFRIGIDQKVVSNVNQGGGITTENVFLNSYYKNEYQNIKTEIRSIVNTLPYKIEKKLGKQYMTFGFDFGIDENGKLFLFEINDNPLIAPIRSKVAMLRVKYYKYILSNLNN